ncbi:MAG: threonine synthase [Candidatus Aminicenantaceae bacterium]
MIQFKCVFCGVRHPADPMAQLCPDCGEPLLVELPPGRRCIRSGDTALSRYLEFLPIPEVDRSLHLGEGDTPLLPLNRLTKRLHLPPVLVKNEMLNPTASFKDRGTVVSVHMAKSRGLSRIGTVSTGNMAASTAAYGARAGMETFILVKDDTTEEKLLSTAAYGARVVKVEGNYGKLGRESFALGKRHGIYFMNSVDPFRVEGYKATAFEIFEEFQSRNPGSIVVPVSSGGHLIGLMKAFMELKEQGLCSEFPTFFGVQAGGCSPIARAFAEGSLRYREWGLPSTVAQSISNPAPPGGNLALRMIRELGGEVLAVSDEEILSAQRLLAEEEGLFCLPASATTLAGVLDLQERGRLASGEPVVLVATGSGLKNLRAFPAEHGHVYASSLQNLDSLIASLAT